MEFDGTIQKMTPPYERTYVGQNTEGDPYANDNIKTKEISEGFFLLNYPNMTSKMDSDNIEDPTATETVKKLEEEGKGRELTPMESACVYYTKNIVVPYGIDYIDMAKTKRNDYVADSDMEYYVFDDATNLYKQTGGPYYEMFKYNPDIKSVFFAEGSVVDFPDRFFEGARYLNTVTFDCDVENLGYLPFFMPDTEAYVPRFTNYEPDSFPHRGPGVLGVDVDNKSHIQNVEFIGETDTATSENQYYYTKTDEFGDFTGIIYSKNDNRKIDSQLKPLKIEQIVPSRGDTDGCGSKEILDTELEVDVYAPYAARDCDAITSVSFPDDGCDISYGCFMDCDKLATVNMPDEMFTAYDRSFAGLVLP